MITAFRPFYRLALSFCTTLSAIFASDDDARSEILKKFHAAKNYEQVKPLVSGILEKQFLLLSKSPEKTTKTLERIRVLSHQTKWIQVDENTTFAYLEDIKTSAEKAAPPIVYVFHKSGARNWTIGNRLMPSSIIKDLWIRPVSLSEINQSSQCSIGQRDLSGLSATAVRENDKLTITLYPFKHSDAEIAHWKSLSGQEINPDSYKSSRLQSKISKCVLVVYLEKNQTLKNINFTIEELNGQQVWQPQLSAISEFELKDGYVKIYTVGNLGTEEDLPRWQINLRLPVWTKGLE